MLKSPISLKLGTNVRYQELTYVTECRVKILNSLGDPGSPCKNRHFARFMHNYNTIQYKFYCQLPMGAFQRQVLKSQVSQIDYQ